MAAGLEGTRLRDEVSGVRLRKMLGMLKKCELWMRHERLLKKELRAEANSCNAVSLFIKLVD